MTADVAPSPSAWPTRLWPAEDPAPAGTEVLALALALALGALAALTLRLQGLGLAAVLVGVSILAGALRSTRSRPSHGQLWWAVSSCALLGVCAVRGAGWLGVLCLVGAVAVGSLALVPARTWTGLALGAVATSLVGARATRWVRPGLRAVRPAQLPTRRAGAVAGVTALLLAVFGGLFAAADPAYATLVGRLLPELQVTELARRLLVAVATSAAVVVASCLAQSPPAVDALAPGPGRSVRRWEWVLPLAVLDALFVSFVAVQLTVLFGGRSHVLATSGLSYADYARSGFWQLLVVTFLTLGVVAVAVRTAPRTTGSDRTVLRCLLGVLCGTALVVVVSAGQRMALYQQEYGFTRLRLLVDAVELSLGAVFVLLLASGVRLSGRWLPRSVVAVAIGALLVLAALDPDAWIARHNIERYGETGRLDVSYLAGLSVDAVPALLTLPVGPRECALAALSAQLRTTDDPWYDVNFARQRARALLADQPTRPCVSP